MKKKKKYTSRAKLAKGDKKTKNKIFQYLLRIQRMYESLSRGNYKNLNLEVFREVYIEITINSRI